MRSNLAFMVTSFVLVYIPIFTASAGGPTEGDLAYEAVKNRIYENASQTLAHYPKLSVGSLLAAVFRKGDLSERSTDTFANPSDFKARAPKLFHPMGVCAEAKWEITTPNAGTGLFEAGTKVKSIVRISAADANTVFKEGEKRIFGIAVKLFPESGDSANFFTLDQNGLDGGTCDSVLVSKADSIYFQNTAKGGGLPIAVLNWVLKKFDRDPSHQPLNQLTAVKANGVQVINPVTPEVIRLVPNLATQAPVMPDFRSELLGYEAGQIKFDIAMPGQGKIGELTLGKPVASVGCDQDIHFHHQSH